MGILSESTKNFREELQQRSREELLDLIETQDSDLLKEVERIEWVFANKLSHLNWADGTPVLEHKLTNEELALLIDEPFQVNKELTEIGYSAVMQRELHLSKDPVLWGKKTLGIFPRAYQILIIRNPSLFKVLRSGRRAGKTFGMALIALHYGYTTANGKVLVLTPMKTQGQLIYEEIMKFIKASPEVGECVTRNVTSPQYEINLSNGSTIRFFSTGMKSGGRSDVTRGQEAHLIILDELDYMGDDDLEAVFAMMQKTAENQPDKQMIGASTPTGRRSIFWGWCNDIESPFVEFWYPSYVNPHWDMKMESFFRGQYTEMGFRHEIEADWGEDVDGVYPRKYVDISFHGNDWSYMPQRVNQDTFYVMGVDWDKYGAGTNIVVLEVFGKDHPDKKLRKKYRIVYREEVKKEEYLLLKAVDRIVELDHAFNLKHIYVDRGYGEVQVELLHKYGKEHANSNLDTKLVGVAFNESIEIRDPHLMQIVKKDAKAFMVDNLRQFFEKQLLLIPEHDEELYKQLISYVVIRQTQSGKPVFEAPELIGDHVHDALMLACYAITDNYGEFLNMNYATNMVVVKNDFFSPVADLSSHPGERQKEEEYYKDKYGSIAAAPVKLKRAGLGPGKRRSKSFRRKMF